MSRINSNSKSRRWCFTINNPEENTNNQLQQLDVKYLVYQHETSNTGTPHIQGYVEFNHRYRLSRVKSFTGQNTAHWEIARGSSAQNKRYCSKEGGTDRFEKGTPIDGKDKTIDLIEDIEQYATKSEIKNKYPVLYLTKHAGIDKLIKYRRRDPDVPPEIIIMYGQTGSGKTRMAHQICKNKSMFKVNLYSRDFCMDGYDGQEILLFDEFRSQIPFAVLLLIVDRYSCNQNIKFGRVTVTASQFIFTSNISPLDWYRDRTDKAALYRRFDEWGTTYRCMKNRWTIVHNLYDDYLDNTDFST